MRIHRSIFLSAAMAVAVAAPSTALPGNGGNDPQAAKSTVPANVYYDCDNDTETTTQPDGSNFLAYQGDLILWPPNHKPTDHTIVAQDREDAGPVEMSTTSSHDELGMNGAGDPNNTDVDGDATVEGDGSATNTVTLLAERSGRGDGRTYSINVQAVFEDDADCMHTFNVEVPHDMRSSNAPAKKDQSDNG